MSMCKYACICKSFHIRYHFSYVYESLFSSCMPSKCRIKPVVLRESVCVCSGKSQYLYVDGLVVWMDGQPRGVGSVVEACVHAATPLHGGALGVSASTL